MNKAVDLKEFSKTIKKLNSVAIIAHVRPDGDTLGSCLALSLALDKLGIDNRVYCSDAVPDKFFIFKGAEKISNALEKKYACFIAVDCAEITRLGDFGAEFLSAGLTMNIDHHVSNTRYAQFNYVFDSASNAENVFSLIKELGVEIDKDIAECLLLGIVTDTGNFKHKNVTGKTLFSAGELVEKGADLNKIVYSMFNSQSKERAKLFGLTMSKIRYFFEGRFAVATVRLSDVMETGAKQSDTEGFIDFVMGVNSVEVGACVMETERNKFKISFRSKSVNVNEIASQFGGGGHVLASGCQIFGDYEEVIDKLQFTVSRYLPDFYL